MTTRDETPDPRPASILPKLDALGITPADWTRIRSLVEAVTPIYSPPALWDLDAPVAVAAMVENPRYRSSKRIGVVVRPDGVRVVLIWWEIGEHDLDQRTKSPTTPRR